MISIKHSDKCIGLRAGDTIYLHPELVNYPQLYKAVLKHEKQHAPQAGMNWREWRMEMTAINKYIRRDFIRFIWRNPKCLMQLLPFQKIDNYVLFDLEACLIVVLLCFVVWGLPW